MHFDTTRRALIWASGEATQSWKLKVRLSTEASRYLYERRGALHDLPIYSRQFFAMIGKSIDEALTSLVGSEWSDRPEVVMTAFAESTHSLKRRLVTICGGEQWALACHIDMVPWEFSLTTAHGDRGASARLALSLGGAIGYDEMDIIRRGTFQTQAASSLGCYLCAFDYLFTGYTMPARTREAIVDALMENLNTLRNKLRR